MKSPPASPTAFSHILLAPNLVLAYYCTNRADVYIFVRPTCMINTFIYRLHMECNRCTSRKLKVYGKYYEELLYPRVKHTTCNTIYCILKDDLMITKDNKSCDSEVYLF